MRLRTGIPALVALALFAACASGPPRDPHATRTSDLVELSGVDPTIRIELRYATPNNFTGRAVYPPEARAQLQRPAAEALARVSAALRPKGYGLLVFDGYRPWSVTKLFWDITPPEKRAFVADPKQGSRHNRGCAVDLTLYELASGKEVEMPSPWDDFTEKASPEYQGGTAEQRAHRDLLRAAMEAEGFTVYENEWWHFDYKGWEEWPVMDVGVGR